MLEKRFDSMPLVLLLGALLALFVGAGFSQERVVAPAQRAVIVISGSCHRPGSGTFYGRMLAAVLSSGWR